MERMYYDVQVTPMHAHEKQAEFRTISCCALHAIEEVSTNIHDYAYHYKQFSRDEQHVGFRLTCEDEEHTIEFNANDGQ